jgi:hypothetical protein
LELVHVRYAHQQCKPSQLTAHVPPPLLVCFCCPAGSIEALPTAYQQQPELACKALELAARTKQDTAATPRARLRALSSASCVLRFCNEAATAGPAEQQQMCQLFGLALSCLKQASAVPSGNNRKLTAASLEAAAAAVAAAAALGGALASQQQLAHSDIADRDTASSSSSAAHAPSTGSKGAAGRMGLVLAARGLLAAGQHMSSINEAASTGESEVGTAAPASTSPRHSNLSSSCASDHDDNDDSASDDEDDRQPEAAAAAEAGSSSAGEFAAVLEDHLKSFDTHVRWLGLALPAAELPGGPGSEQACAAAKQQLLQLQGRLQQGLQDAVGKADSSSGSSDAVDVSGSDIDGAAAAAASELPPAVAAATAAIAQQMVALGEALCAQLPLAHCCNNPGCVELRGASELQLVGGKGCVCSRCR